MLSGLVLKRGLKTFSFFLGLTWKINHFKTLATYTFLLKLGPCLILTIRPSWNKLKVFWIVGIHETFPWLAIFVLLKLFCCHNSFIYFQFCVSKFPNMFWSLTKCLCFTNLFGMGEMIGPKELAFVTIIMIVGFVWLTLIISPEHKKWYGSNYYSMINFKVFWTLMNYQRWIANAVICCRNHYAPESLFFFLLFFFFFFFLKMDCIVLCLLIHSELGISIVNGHVKKFITPIFLTLWISVYGITDDQIQNKALYLSWRRVWKRYIDDLLNPNSHAPFFVSRLSRLRKGSKNGGSPPGFRTGGLPHQMHCAPMARHPGVAARATISFPYETRFYDVIGLSAFSSLLLVGFCWTVDG